MAPRAVAGPAAGLATLPHLIVIVLALATSLAGLLRLVLRARRRRDAP